jgi:FdhD protein
MEEKMTAKHRIIRYESGVLRDQVDEMAREYPLTIQVNGREFVTLVCSPDHIEELIVGFLASEGVIRLKKDINKLTVDQDTGFAYVDLVQPVPIESNPRTKRVIGSCCGKSRHFYFQEDVKTAKTAMSRLKVKAETCLSLMDEMQQKSLLFQHTGGVHNAALCTKDHLLLSRTDIGRHNALDKLYGYCLMKGISVRDKVLVFSGRISSEVLLKAAKIGVAIILSKSAPTELAVQMAEDLNITTVGFIRNGSFNVYTHHERIET